MRLRPTTAVVGHQAKEAKEAKEAMEAKEAKEGRQAQGGRQAQERARQPQFHLTSMLWQNNSLQY